jgi:hypothetical protein
VVLQDGIGSVDGDLIVGLQDVVRIKDLREEKVDMIQKKKGQEWRSPWGRIRT